MEEATIADKHAALKSRAAADVFAGALHCVPMIVKDNFETQGLPSAKRPVDNH